MLFVASIFYFCFIFAEPKISITNKKSDMNDDRIIQDALNAAFESKPLDGESYSEEHHRDWNDFANLVNQRKSQFAHQYDKLSKEDIEDKLQDSFLDYYAKLFTEQTSPSVSYFWGIFRNKCYDFDKLTRKKTQNVVNLDEFVNGIKAIQKNGAEQEHTAWLISIILKNATEPCKAIFSTFLKGVSISGKGYTDYLREILESDYPKIKFQQDLSRQKRDCLSAAYNFLKENNYI